jgi:hypothetical protein
VQDTQPKATARYFELLRQAGPERRLAMCASLCRATRELAIAGIKATHLGRELTDLEIRRALAERLYGRQVAQRLFARERA